jgi:REP element-mobilizing transposase RayT
MMQNEFSIHRRTLPHWRLIGATYFVTWRLHQTQHPLSPDERSSVSNAVNHFNGERYQLIAYVIMDDHAHAVVTPYANCELSSILHTWKSYTSHQLSKKMNRKAPVWQHESYNRIMRNKRELEEKVQYVATNPVRRWPEIREYEWVRVYEGWE